MKDKAIVMLTAAVVVVFGGALWMFTPMLQSSGRKLDERVGESAERARRMLDKFNAESDAMAVVLDHSGVTADLNAERIDAIVTDDHRDAQANLEAEAVRIGEMRQAAAGRQRSLDNQFTELDPGAELPRSPSLNLSGSPEQMKRTLAEAAKWRADYQKQNRTRVSDALSVVDGAIRDSEGDATGADSVTANRLRAIALFQEADVAAREAALARADADRTLFDMVTASRMLATTENQPAIARAADIDDAIAQRRADVAQAQSRHDTVHAAVAELEATTAELSRRIDNQAAVASEARRRMEALEERGLDFSRRDSADRFTADYGVAAREYRTAIRIEHALRHGTLDNARIDASGDYLTGEFVSATPGGKIQYVRGLDDYAADLAGAREELAGRVAGLQQARERLAEAETMRGSMDTANQRAVTQAVELKQQIATRFDVYTQAVDAARAAEDLAVEEYGKSARAFQAAQQASRKKVNNVPTDKPQEVIDRSPWSLIQGDKWQGAEAKCEAADANIWAALVWFERHDQLSRAVAFLREVNDRVALSGFDPDAVEQASTEAHMQGAALAASAVKALESAARDLQNHWTVAASAAGANYVLSLFDQPELRGLAIQNYTAVVKDREDDPIVRPFKQRLEQLKKQ